MADRRLFITEDDTGLLQMLCWDFEELGYQVSTACCCHEALKAISTSHFDLALLDYNLPDGVGTELIQALHHRQPGLPVIVYSGAGPEAGAAEAVRKGACQFVTKPIGARALHAIFNSVLGGGLVLSGLC
ncbi:MAG: response regulator [Gammaproteobacteria bacterium]|nr:response regulator [Gammaproteobacteria bacterium]